MEQFDHKRRAARENNLRTLSTCGFCWAWMTRITGVSGSGKSSLAKGILYPALRFTRASSQGTFWRRIGKDVQLSNRSEMIDQEPRFGKSQSSREFGSKRTKPGDCFR